MSANAEKQGEFIGQVPPAVEGLLVPVGSSRELNPGSLNPEVLDPASVEVKFGDPETDAPRLLELFTQRSTIEHLANITPYTTVNEIRRLYRGPRAQRLILLTAETPSGLIVGTYSLKPPGRGSRAAEGGLLAVDEADKYRRKGIGRKLVKAGNALTFREGDGGLDCSLCDVYVVTRVVNSLAAEELFEKEGFEIKAYRPEGTFSWDNKVEQLVSRSSHFMTLTRKFYKDNFPEDHIKYFPKQRPPKEA